MKKYNIAYLMSLIIGIMIFACSCTSPAKLPAGRAEETAAPLPTAPNVLQAISDRDNFYADIEAQARKHIANDRVDLSAFEDYRFIQQQNLYKNSTLLKTGFVDKASENYTLALDYLYYAAFYTTQLGDGQLDASALPEEAQIELRDKAYQIADEIKGRYNLVSMEHAKNSVDEKGNMISEYTQRPESQDKDAILDMYSDLFTKLDRYVKDNLPREDKRIFYEKFEEIRSYLSTHTYQEKVSKFAYESLEEMDALKTQTENGAISYGDGITKVNQIWDQFIEKVNSVIK